MKKIIVIYLFLFLFAMCNIEINAATYELIKDDNLGRSLNLVKNEVSEATFLTNLVFDYDKLYENVVSKKITIGSGNRYEICEDSLENFVSKSTKSMNFSESANIDGIATAKIINNFNISTNVSKQYFQKYYKKYESKVTYQTYLENPAEDYGDAYSRCVSDGYKNSVINAHRKVVLNNDYSEFFRIFDDYGTHILTKANYGCSVETYGFLSSNKIDLENYDSISFSNDLSARFDDTSFAFASSGSFTTNISGSTENETGYYNSYYRGLNGATFNKWVHNYDEWERLATDQLNSVLIDDPNNSFVPIWQYLKWSNESESITQEFKKAYDEYKKNHINCSQYDFSGIEFNFNENLGYKIHDTGRWEKENNRFYIDMSDCFTKAMLLDEKSYLLIYCDYSFKLIDDGYQYILLYTSINELDAKLLYETELPGGSKKSYTEGSFNCSFDGSEFESIGFGVLFGTSGKFEDDWIIDKLKFKVELKKRSNT